MEEPTEKLKRVARCNTCSHEWIPRKQDAKNPSRCTECGSRDVKWRDECTPPAPEPEPEQSQPADGEPATDSQDKNTPPELPEQGEPADLEKPISKGKEETEPQPQPTEGDMEKAVQKEIAKLPKIPALGMVFILAGIAAVGLVIMTFRRSKKSPPAPKPAQDGTADVEKQNEEALIRRIQQNNRRI